MIVRCTAKLLNLLGKHAVTLVEVPADDDDWYANMLWLDRRKCLLVVHAGTLFPIFVADIRVNDLRPIGGIVDLLRAALLDEQLPIDALGQLDPDDVLVAKTASRHVLGVMNEMGFECGWRIVRAGGLWNVNIDELNRRLRGGLHTKRRLVPSPDRTRTRAATPHLTVVNRDESGFRHPQASA